MKASASIPIPSGGAWNESLFVEYGDEASVMAGETSSGVVNAGEPFVVLGEAWRDDWQSTSKKFRAMRPRDARAFATEILKACDRLDEHIATSGKVIPLPQPAIARRRARGTGARP